MLHITYMQRIRLVAVTAVLLAAVWFGVKEGFNGWSGAETRFQHVAAALQVSYGLLAVASLVALFRRHAWLRPIVIAWAVVVTLTGTVATVAWGGGPWIGGILAGAITAVVAGLVAWGAMRASFTPTPGSSSHA